MPNSNYADLVDRVNSNGVIIEQFFIPGEDEETTTLRSLLEAMENALTNCKAAKTALGLAKGRLPSGLQHADNVSWTGDMYSLKLNNYEFTHTVFRHALETFDKAYNKLATWLCGRVTRVLNDELPLEMVLPTSPTG